MKFLPAQARGLKLERREKGTGCSCCHPQKIVSALAKVEMSSSLIDCWLVRGARRREGGRVASPPLLRSPFMLRVVASLVVRESARTLARALEV